MIDAQLQRWPDILCASTRTALQAVDLLVPRLFDEISKQRNLNSHVDMPACERQVLELVKAILDNQQPVDSFSVVRRRRKVRFYSESVGFRRGLRHERRACRFLDLDSDLLAGYAYQEILDNFLDIFAEHPVKPANDVLTLSQAEDGKATRDPLQTASDVREMLHVPATELLHLGAGSSLWWLQFRSNAYASTTAAVTPRCVTDEDDWPTVTAEP